MLRQQINILGLAVDNIKRAWKIYLLLIMAVALSTAIIVFLFLASDGLQRTAQANLMQLPLNKIWLRPGKSDPASPSFPDILITAPVIKELEQDPDIIKLWPQVDYSRAAIINLSVNILTFNHSFEVHLEIYGVKEELIRDDLFEKSEFKANSRGEIPIILPAGIANMINKRASEKTLPPGKRLPLSIVKRFPVSLLLATLPGLSSHGYQKINCRPVGVSDRIPEIGVAVPMNYVKLWNARYGGVTGGGEYSRVLIETSNPEKAAVLSKRLEERDFTIESSRETFETIQRVFTGVRAALIVLGMLIIAAVGIGLFNGMTLVVHSEREIMAIMRAVGARRRSILEIILLQALATGLIGGIIGTALAFGTAFGMEGHLLSLLKDNGLKADILFQFKQVLLIGGLLVPPLVCLLFGLLPAAKAVNTRP